MPSSRKNNKRDSRSNELRTSKLAVLSVVFLLINVFQWLAFRNVDVLIISFLSVVISFIGWIIGMRALKAIKRRQGVLQGEGAGLIGYWANFALWVLSFFYFLWNFLLAIMRGELI
jgi:hypothetical protein